MEHSKSSNIGSPEVGDVAHKETPKISSVDSLKVGDVVLARTPDALNHKFFYNSLSGKETKDMDIKKVMHRFLILETHFDDPHRPKFVRAIGKSTSVSPDNLAPAAEALLVPVNGIIKKAGEDNGYFIMHYINFTDPITDRLKLSLLIPKAEAGVSDAQIEALKEQVAEVESKGLYKLQVEKGAGDKAKW